MKKKGKYISHNIQNELLSIMSHQVLNKLLVWIRDTMFSLICDDYTDCCNKELLTLCLSWVTDNLDVFEHFMGFYEIPDIKSSTIVSFIKDIMIRFQLQFNKCRGQCYDRASIMLGKKSGVAMQIKELQPKAHYTHYHGHSISLSVKEVTKRSKVLGNTMCVAEEIVVLIKYSSKREKHPWLHKKQMEFESELEEKANDITKLSQT